MRVARTRGRVAHDARAHGAVAQVAVAAGAVRLVRGEDLTDAALRGVRHPEREKTTFLQHNVVKNRNMVLTCDA